MEHQNQKHGKAANAVQLGDVRGSGPGLRTIRDFGNAERRRGHIL
jgi:hypothetical protein